MSDDAAQPKRIRVLAAVIRRGEHVLICKRPLHKRHGGLWEFPGGKLEAGETLLDGARRELAEELGLQVSGLGQTLFVCNDPDSVFAIEFVEVHADGEPQAIEHDEMRWATCSEVVRCDLAPADAAFVRQWLGDT